MYICRTVAARDRTAGDEGGSGERSSRGRAGNTQRKGWHMRHEIEATRRRAVDLSTARDAEERPRMAFWALWEDLKRWQKQALEVAAREAVFPRERTEDDFTESFDSYRERQS